MNRKDFDTTARAVKAMREDRYLQGYVDRVADILACAFQMADGCSGFDRAKFLKACGVINAAP